MVGRSWEPAISILLALLAAPPAALDLEDGTSWDRAHEALLDGPAGCWEVVGRASWSHDLGRWGGTRGESVFVGRITDGVWGSFRVFPQGEVDQRSPASLPTYAPNVRFTPMIGQVRGLHVMLDAEREVVVNRSKDPRVDPVNTVRDVLEQLSDDVETWWVRWDDEAGAVVYERSTVAGRRDAELRTWVRFPQGGLLPDRYELALEGTYVHSGWVPARVHDLAVELRGRIEGGTVLPQAEAMRFRLGLPFVRVEIAQTLEYTHVSPCAPG